MTSWILLEQEANLQDMMLAMVEIMGDEGVAFSDDEDAFAWIESVENGKFLGTMPELALLEMGMYPDEGGPAVAARLRSSRRLKDIIIVFMTPDHHHYEEQESLVEEVGANFVLYRPLPSTDELGYILQGLLLSR